VECLITSKKKVFLYFFKTYHLLFDFGSKTLFFLFIVYLILTKLVNFGIGLWIWRSKYKKLLVFPPKKMLGAIVKIQTSHRTNLCSIILPAPNLQPKRKLVRFNFTDIRNAYQAGLTRSILLNPNVRRSPVLGAH
jgi:hypothetical protein